MKLLSVMEKNVVTFQFLQRIIELCNATEGEVNFT